MILQISESCKYIARNLCQHNRPQNVQWIICCNNWTTSDLYHPAIDVKLYYIMQFVNDADETHLGWNKLLLQIKVIVPPRKGGREDSNLVMNLLMTMAQRLLNTTRRERDPQNYEMRSKSIINLFDMWIKPQSVLFPCSRMK